MAITDKKGINVTSGFKLVSKQPLDARLIAVDETDLQSLIDNGAVYDGMIVWVQSLSKYMSYNGTEFKELATGGGGGTPAYVENETLFLGDVSSGGGSSSSGGNSSGGNTEEYKTLTITLNSTDNVKGLPQIDNKLYSYSMSSEQFSMISNLKFSEIKSIYFESKMGGYMGEEYGNVSSISKWYFIPTYVINEAHVTGGTMGDMDMPPIFDIMGTSADRKISDIISLNISEGIQSPHFNISACKSIDNLINILSFIDTPLNNTGAETAILTLNIVYK